MNRVLLAGLQAAIMIAVAITTTGAEHWLAGFGKTEAARMMLGRTGLALPYALAGGAGLILLFAAAGAIAIRAVGWGVVTGSAAVIGIAVIREGVRLAAAGVCAAVASERLL